MNIQSGTPSYQSVLRQTLSITDRPSFERPAPASAAPADAVTLGSGSDFDVVQGLKYGAMGAVPALGAVSNFAILGVTGFSGQDKQAKAAFWGVAANVLGTGALVTGMIIGNNATSLVGAGLLAGSGVAGAYAVQ